MQRIIRTLAIAAAVLIVSGCSGGVDGPAVEGNRRSWGEEAEILGKVVIEDKCLHLDVSEVDTRYPVIWPHGTHWDSSRSAVVLPGGTLVVEGVEVYGGGGYHGTDQLSDYTTADGVALLSSCVDNEYGEIAVFNSSGKIEVQGN
jgi:hypothetical protein